MQMVTSTSYHQAKIHHKNRWFVEGQKLLWMMLAILCVWGNISLASDTRQGSAGATELLIPVDAKGVALGGAIGASVSGAEAMYWNPAGLAGLENPELSVSTLSYLADIQLHQFAIGVPISNFGSVGLMIKTLDFGQIPLTTNEDPEGELGRSYSPTFFAGAVSWAKAFTPNFALGINAKYIHEEIINALASGPAFDVGLQAQGPFDLKLGLTMQNIGGNLRFAGNSLNAASENEASESTAITAAEFELPSFFELSIAQEIDLGKWHLLEWMASYRQYGFQSDDMHLGLAYGFRQQFFLRAGYEQDLSDEQHSVFAGSYALGCGLKYTIYSYQVFFDYAYRSAKYFSGNHAFTIRLGF